MRMLSAQEHPVVLQLGGSDPAACLRLTAGWVLQIKVPKGSKTKQPHKLWFMVEISKINGLYKNQLITGGWAS